MAEESAFVLPPGINGDVSWWHFSKDGTMEHHGIWLSDPTQEVNYDYPPTPDKVTPEDP